MPYNPAHPDALAINEGARSVFVNILTTRLGGINFNNIDTERLDDGFEKNFFGSFEESDFDVFDNEEN